MIGNRDEDSTDGRVAAIARDDRRVAGPTQGARTSPSGETISATDSSLARSSQNGVTSASVPSVNFARTLSRTVSPSFASTCSAGRISRRSTLPRTRRRVRRLPRSSRGGREPATSPQRTASRHRAKPDPLLSGATGFGRGWPHPTADHLRRASGQGNPSPARSQTGRVAAHPCPETIRGTPPRCIRTCPAAQPRAVQSPPGRSVGFRSRRSDHGETRATSKAAARAKH